MSLDKMSSGSEKKVVFLFTVCLHMFFSLHGRVLTCIRGCSDELCSKTMVFGGVPETAQ